MLILASSSPRRHELLRLITNNFTVITQPTCEDVPASFTPPKTVETLALRKARAVAVLYPSDTVIGADTVVELESKIFGKPRDAADAVEILSALSGKAHHVYTGAAIIAPSGEHVFHEETTVYFREMTRHEIESYVKSGEPFDKAGAYGVQGAAAVFVQRIDGDYYNIMGLPVCSLYQRLISTGELPEPVVLKRM